MKEAFQKYGRFFSFGLTYRIIQSTQKQVDEYKVGFFTGTSPKCKVIPYGYVITISEKASLLKVIF